MRIILISIIGILILDSCSVKEDNNRNQIVKTEFIDSHDLVVTDSISILVDSVTPTSTQALQFFEFQGTKYLATLNMRANTINVYDIFDQSYSKRIVFEKDGPNGVGIVEGFTIINYDTIIVNSRYMMYLVDSTGMPFHKANLLDKIPEDEISGIIGNDTQKRAVLVENKIYLGSIPDVRFNDLEMIDKAKVVYSYDLITESLSMHLPFPEVYTEEVFSPHYIALFSSTYNSKINKFVHSFPSYANVVVTDYVNFDEYYAGSDCCVEIEHSEKSEPSKREYHQLFFTKPSYSNILYDEYRDVYYRFILLGISDNDFDNKEWERGLMIITLDAGFRKIAEVTLDKSRGISSHMSFITEEGLHLKTKSGNENEMLFTTFKLNKK